ncbi:hypothetical protein [Aurantimicrobium minutum]|uniref:hypothetical protein n=1 Tax=Aurantimicrobium minutum TaxID=708131 RepID=UPI002474D750|nr:hypothetical protein [Aurantimicrobium minutum]MDH6255411.1 hypothetical protein [Aurantimicrobium minutum]
MYKNENDENTKDKTRNQIRFATAEELEKIAEFISSEWASDHVFVRSPEMLAWQHLDERSQKLNFLINEIDGQIAAILGFIPDQHYSNSMSTNRVFLAIWKTAEKFKNSGAGLRLLQSIRNYVDADLIGVIGISEEALKIYKLLGYTTGKMNHHVVFNQGVIHKIALNAPIQKVSATEVLWRKISFSENTLFEKLVNTDSGNSKNYEYLQSRYANHPYFKYTAYYFEINTTSCVLIIREINIFGSKIGKIVDVLGDASLVPKTCGALFEISRINQYEYIDIYSTGLNLQEMKKQGFLLVESASSFVVPNYFEPFVQQNIEMYFAWKNFTNDRLTTLFRGDSDQDRPNLLEAK